MWVDGKSDGSGGTINPTIIINQVLSANQSKNETIDTSKNYLSVTCLRVADSTKRMGVCYVGNSTVTQLQSGSNPQYTLNGTTLTLKNTSSSYFLEWTLIQLD